MFDSNFSITTQCVIFTTLSPRHLPSSSARIKQRPPLPPLPPPPPPPPPRIFCFSHRCLPYVVFIMKFSSSSSIPTPSSSSHLLPFLSVFRLASLWLSSL
ncbi:hypothetical protein L195_g034278 [Trifolium pratense]|uniref:Uncharacterized protein n=1 Tax=Trifolium pratense TaxID=57577 RepID=A0A2K3LID4_TRIPR|nr:hypothetical protein L195_g034278 [Trifolium pratense]